jgi:hypothetical protein
MSASFENRRRGPPRRRATCRKDSRGLPRVVREPGALASSREPIPADVHDRKCQRPSKPDGASQDDDYRRAEGRHDMTTIKTADGTPLYYKDWGKRPVVAFSHGWPLSSDSWEAQMLYLAERGFRCVATPTTASRYSRRRITPKIANAGQLSAKLVKGATFKGYRGAPHGLANTHKDQLNEDLLTGVAAVSTGCASPAATPATAAPRAPVTVHYRKAAVEGVNVFY